MPTSHESTMPLLRCFGTYSVGTSFATYVASDDSSALEDADIDASIVAAVGAVAESRLSWCWRWLPAPTTVDEDPDWVAGRAPERGAGGGLAGSKGSDDRNRRASRLAVNEEPDPAVGAEPGDGAAGDAWLGTPVAPVEGTAAPPAVADGRRRSPARTELAPTVGGPAGDGWVP